MQYQSDLSDTFPKTLCILKFSSYVNNFCHKNFSTILINYDSLESQYSETPIGSLTSHIYLLELESIGNIILLKKKSSFGNNTFCQNG